ncbi:unnamed protein product [Zymoseptoria tritici ST99CH_3D1]|nr:unnamed protein product [Zymoseptoria tritici ST99CH_3D1]
MGLDHRHQDREEDSESSEGSNNEPSDQCEDDRCRGPQPPIWHCVDCDSSYCSECWGLQGPHKPKKKGRDGMPHERTSPHVVRSLKGILNPTRNSAEIQKLHEDDEATKWFGVTRDATAKPTFQDYGRYATLMSNISPLENQSHRYPQIVSFIGVTNAGKSTLIKMLVNHELQEQSAVNRSMFPSPVVGSVVNDAVPTSGDVHLYADPATHAEQLPILYADCEGFEGGERTPLGSRGRRKTMHAAAEMDNGDFQPASAQVHSRTIEWANTEETRQREFTVSALYPRLLYTFSDCVVFVLRNPKTFQSAVLGKLLEWGASSLEKSINQPALPHCIVAVNGSDPSVDGKEWDVDYATQNLLSSVRGALDSVEGVPRFRALAEHWRSLGKHIYTVEDLILRYYSSFKVVRIPAKPRYTTISEQVGKLQQMIKSNCEESFRNKRRARMLSTADELQIYLQAGFDHFTTHLDVPFDFMQISLLRNPIPNDFGGHILQLCATISSQQPNHQPGRITWIFEKLSVMLASCVLLDCARFRKGQVEELFSSYEKFFDWAMGEYLEMHYPCSYVSADGTRQCMLVKARHLPKGHQDEQGIIATGDYQAAFDSNFLQTWKAQLRAAVATIQRDFQYELEQITEKGEIHTISEESLALDLHIDYLNTFFEAVGPASSISSHATCFCCLMDVPEHPLPCGHVLCTACIKAYGKQKRSSVVVSCCPLHRESTNWAKPQIIKFKPAGAGARVLSLDGGGIRGIVQLEVLRAIENVLGGHISAPSFFDLIVGTGTGGLLAAALSLKERTVESCIDMFTALCDHAYTRRRVPIISHIASVLGSGPKYKTKPLISALQTAFGPDDAFFGSNNKFRNGSRVGITSTSATGQDTILLASYRRPDDLKPAYAFERPHDPELEMKTFEALAASLANPNLFRPFIFHNKAYLDGGLRLPNPAVVAERERRLIWPDSGQPDMFLSLGTGQNRLTVLQKLSDRPKDSSASIISAANPRTLKLSSGRWRSRRADDVLDAELAWADFRAEIVKDSLEARGRRFIRFNPDLDKDPPSGDNKSEMLSLQLNVRKRLQTAHRQAALRNVAHRLVASSFYLELQSKATAEKSEQVCAATIVCRFDDGSPEMAALGHILKDRRVDDFEPYFLIKPNQDQKETSFKVTITADVTAGMINNHVFGLPNTYIPLRDESKATSITLFLTKHDGLEPDGFPISGFPKVLLGEQPSAKTKPRRAVRESTEPMRRNGKSSDGDSVSLNGGPDGSDTASIQELTSKFARNSMSSNNGRPKMSLADLIDQHQNSGTSIKARTNRFWTYIGNNHMAQNPDMYTEDELSKYAVNASADDSPNLERPPRTSSITPITALPPMPAAPQPTLLHSRHYIPTMTPGFTEIDADNKPAFQVSRRTLTAQSGNNNSCIDLSISFDPGMSRQPSNDSSADTLTRSNSQVTWTGSQQSTRASETTFSSTTHRNTLPSVGDDGFEDDGDWYSGDDVSLGEAQPTSLVQLAPAYPVRSRNSTSTIDAAVAGALPDENAKVALDRWLTSQKSSLSIRHSKGEKLKAVQEEE